MGKKSRKDNDATLQIVKTVLVLNIKYCEMFETLL